MTPEEIRATAVERLAVAQFEMDESDYSSERLPHRAWDKVPEMVRQRYRADARRLLPALDDMLPTGQDWFTRMPGGVLWPSPGHSEAAARTWSKTQGAPLLRQWTHEPVEVTE